MKVVARYWWWVIALVVVGASVLRFWNYDRFPVTGETKDELAWTWLGASILQEGKPQSWSFFKAYPNPVIFDSGDGVFPIVSPALDHPPLFALLPGLMHTLKGAEWNALPSYTAIRFPLLALGTLNMVLFSAWMTRTWGRGLWSIASIVLYATVPSWVFLSRMALSENMLVTWTLGLLLLETFSGSWTRWAKALLVFLLPLTKLSGLAVALAWWVVECTRSRATRRDRVIWTLILGCSVVGALSWFSWWDLGLFWEVQTQQSQRDVGLLTLFETQLWIDVLIQKRFADPWILLGWMSLVLWWWSPSKQGDADLEVRKTINALVAAQLAFLLLSVGEHTVHGWYRIVFQPFWAVSLGWAVKKVWDEQNWWGLLWGWLCATAIIRGAGVMVLAKEWYEVQGSLARVWITSAGGMVLCALAGQLFTKRVRQTIWYAFCSVLVVAVVLSHVLTVVYAEQTTYWQDAVYLDQGLRP